MSNYPDGAENDPDAPWNRKETPEFIDCDENDCIQCNRYVFINEDGYCEKCYYKYLPTQGE